MAGVTETEMNTAGRIEALILQGGPYLDDQKPFVTMDDLAHELDVAKETIRRNIDEAVKHPMIDTARVGQARVFWKSYTADQSALSNLSDSHIENYFQNKKDELIQCRALWLQRKQELLNGTMGMPSPQERRDLWRLLGAYLDYMDELGTVSFAVAVKKQSLPSEYDGLLNLEEFDSDKPALPEGFRHLEDRLFDVHLFDTPFGTEVTGVSMLLPHHIWVATELGEDPTTEEIDEVIPTAKDIHYAGGVVDEFASVLHGFYW